MITTDEKINILTLRAKGLSVAKVAKETGTAKQTIIDLCNASREELATLHAIELEKLYEAEKITAEEQIKSVSSLLRKLREEIDKRDLSDIATDKLIDLYNKTLASLEEVKIKPVFYTSEEQREEEEERVLLSRRVG